MKKIHKIVPVTNARVSWTDPETHETYIIPSQGVYLDELPEHVVKFLQKLKLVKIVEVEEEEAKNKLKEELQKLNPFASEKKEKAVKQDAPNHLTIVAEKKNPEA